MATLDCFPKWTIIGHRGASGTHPENTLPAFVACADLGIQWVECDLQLTQDGEIVIIHDDTIDRTTNGTGPVATQTLPSLQSLDAGGWFQSSFKGTSMPTLEALLTTVTTLGLRVNLELKTVPEGKALVEKTLNLLDKFFPASTPRHQLPLLTSFSFDQMQWIHHADSRWPLGLLLWEWRPDWQSIADALDCVTVHCSHKWLTAWHVEQIQRSGRAALAYTVDEASRAKELKAMGASGIFTNHPEIMVAS